MKRTVFEFCLRQKNSVPSILSMTTHVLCIVYIVLNLTFPDVSFIFDSPCIVLFFHNGRQVGSMSNANCNGCVCTERFVSSQHLV